MTDSQKMIDKCEVERALDRLERRIYSLNYDGYFTKSFFKEFQDILGLMSAYRVFFNGGAGENKIHDYHAEPDMVREKACNEKILQLRAILKSRRPKVIPTHFSISDCRDEYPDCRCKIEINVCSCPEFSSLGYCEKEKKDCCGQNLQSTIVLYSSKPSDIVRSFFENGNWFEKIRKIFRENEEPKCFGHHTFCEKSKSCWWKNRCQTARFSSLDLDEVLRQLKEKFQNVLRTRDELPILIYSPVTRLLSYKAIKYMKFPEPLDWESFKNGAFRIIKTDDDQSKFNIKEEFSLAENVLRLKHENQGELIALEKKYTESFNTVVKELRNSSSFDEFSKGTGIESAKVLFEAVTQRLSTGLTKSIWHSFENFSFEIHKLKLDQNEEKKKGERLRKFCEHLFFTFRGTLIVTPLGYLGQKIGIVFAMQGVKKGDEEARKSDVKQLEKKFNDISKEFSPLLFHSLQAKTYHEALNSLKYRDPREAIDILCEAFAAVFNVTAIVFHVNDNRIVYGFESSDEGVILSRLDSNKHDEVMKELIHDGDSNTAASFLNGNAYGVKAYNFDGTVYTSKEDESKRIRTRSRLLLKINPSDFDKLPVNEGILDIFFDLSEYSLRRNASDIVREIEFIADLIFEAARQKYALMQKSLITAVSAIMGRNMSHNIGSHVLARYSSAVGRVGEQRLREEHLKRIKTGGVDKEEFLIETAVGRGEDHRAVFLRYLQRRMDFVAEVATAEKSFWSQPLSLCGVLSALDLEAEKRRINEDSDSIRYKPILLSYITGKEGMDATVDSGAIRDDPYFTCPGGEVGAHALYVILENIIRNSARHNMGQQKRVKLEVRVEDEDGEDHNDLWCITIIDCQSNTEKVADINRIINTERILKHDGSPNPKCWGIREMQICAQYLRGLPMSELEGKQPNPPVLKAVPRPNESGNDCLAYRIYLQRAKFCALLPARATLKDAGLFDKKCVNELNKKLKPKGIVIFRSSPDASRLQGYSFVVAENAEAQNAALENGKEAVLKLKRNGEEKSIPRLHLPVRTMVVDSGFMKSRLNELRPDKESREGNADTDPEIWLETFHKRLWETYRDKRKDWKGKPIKVLVGWETEAESNNECERIQFCHTMKVNANNTYKYFGTAVQNAGAIGVIWVDHGGATDFRPNSVPSLRSAASLDPGQLYRPIVFAELVESLSPHKPLLEKQKNNVIKGNELVAAALARVIVLDERVQNEMEREYRAGLGYKTLWPCMGIWVPERVTDLNHPNFWQIKEFLMNPAEIEIQFPPDFLVLHLTILENLRKQCGHLCEADTLHHLLADTCADPAEYGCEIIIVTGRGVPSLNRLRYLPISALLEYLMARPSKLALMRALWSAATAN